MLTSDPDIFTQGYFPKNNWIPLVENLEEAYRWVGHFHDSNLSDKNYISLMSRLDIINRDIPVKVYLSINFSESSIYSIISRIKTYSGTHLFLTDRVGNIISSQRKNELNKLFTTITSESKHLQREITDIYLPDYLMICSENTENKFNLLALIPVRELLREQRLFLKVFAGSIIGISTLIILLISRIILSGVNKPIMLLVSFMERVERGNFNTSAPEVYTPRNGGSDEFRYLFESFNRMVRRTKKLIQDLFMEKTLHSEMELKFLQSQINPHFLYNTLDSINWIAKRNGVDEISGIVRDLSNLYRSVFNNGKECITVKEAVIGITSYLAIQSHRFSGRFTFHIDISEDLNDKKILNLIIQPIVENAVIHGIHDGDGDIFITAVEEGGIIIFKIKDTGKGMDQEKLDLLLRSLHLTSTSSDSGLSNVQKRISLFYGTAYGIEIESRAGMGTTVIVRIPSEWREKPNYSKTLDLIRFGGTG
ncbi:MAG: sensor histidine kinase [Spirochaetia bacterium]